jgi:hypothetical protein
MKRARRVIIFSAVFLLGLTVNLGIAWGLALAVGVPPGGGVCVDNSTLESPWLAPVPREYPKYPTFRTHYRGRGWRADMEHWLPRGNELDFYCSVSGSSGLPLPALGGSYGFFWVGSGEVVHWDRWGIAVGSIVPLPMRPLWPGFLINTLLYTALSAGIWYTPGAVRRARRRRRNACQACGYSLVGLAAHVPCPECGTEGRTRP